MVMETLIATVLPMFNESLIESRAPSHEHTRIHVTVLENIDTTTTIYKDVESFTPPQQWTTQQFVDREHRWLDWLYVDLKKDFWNRGLQMVCEVRAIDLTRDQSNYEGEKWHVQGQRHEYICATAILPYSMHNVTQPRSSFRRRVWTEEVGLASVLRTAVRPRDLRCKDWRSSNPAYRRCRHASRPAGHLPEFLANPAPTIRAGGQK